MIVGHHIIFCAYGFWLPNDPRGSWSDFVGSWDLFRYGPATKTTTRRSVAGKAHDRTLRAEAKMALDRPPVKFSDVQIQSVANGFGEYVKESRIAVWACAIMSDHVHLAVGQLSMEPRQLVIQLKGSATQRLHKDNLHPFGDTKLDNGRSPKCFARGEWKVYLDPPDVPRAIQYVENNPIKEGRPKQQWDFITKYDG